MFVLRETISIGYFEAGHEGISYGGSWQERQWQTDAFVILEGNMNSLFCYCCQGLLNIFPQNNKGKRILWKISIVYYQRYTLETL